MEFYILLTKTIHCKKSTKGVLKMEINVNDIEKMLQEVAQKNNDVLIDYYLQKLIDNL